MRTLVSGTREVSDRTWLLSPKQSSGCRAGDCVKHTSESTHRGQGKVRGTGWQPSTIIWVRDDGGLDQGAGSQPDSGKRL